MTAKHKDMRDWTIFFLLLIGNLIFVMTITEVQTTVIQDLKDKTIGIENIGKKTDYETKGVSP